MVDTARSCTKCGRNLSASSSCSWCAGVMTVAGPVATPKIEAPFSQSFLQQYAVVNFLGQGGMGAVYLMRQMKLDRLVAVKVVRSDFLTEEEKQRLLREARVLAKLNHPSILSIYDIGVDGDIPYMVCEYVSGESLHARLHRDPGLTLAQSIRIAVHVLDGLRIAHKSGIAHRDLKPENILLTNEGKPKIVDFGLAKSQQIPSGASIGVIAGTPMYMSPEQARGMETNSASDIYSFGVVLFEMVTGQLPFPGPSTPDYLYQHMRQSPPLIRSISPNLPEALEAVISKALQKESANRLTAVDCMKILADIYKGLGTQSLPKITSKQTVISTPIPVRAMEKERPWKLDAVVIEGVLACLMTAVLFRTLTSMFLGTFSVLMFLLMWSGNNFPRQLILLTSIVGSIACGGVIWLSIVYKKVSLVALGLSAVGSLRFGLEAWLLTRPDMSRFYSEEGEIKNSKDGFKKATAIFCLVLVDLLVVVVLMRAGFLKVPGGL